MSLSRSGYLSRSAAQVPLVFLAGLLALLLIATGCTIPVPTGSAGETTPTETSQAPVPATLQVTPVDGATEVAVVDGEFAFITAQLEDAVHPAPRSSESAS